MKRALLSLILCGIMIILPSNLSGQKVLFPEYRPPLVRFDNFITKNGDANQATVSMMFDRFGFLWSGTETGLYRFDGKKYIEYLQSDTSSAGYAGNVITTLFEDASGNIWIGTAGALNRLDPATSLFTHFVPDTISAVGTNNIIRLIRQDAEGIFWIVTNRSVFSFSEKEEVFREFTIDSLAWRSALDVYGEEPERFLIDTDGNIWFGTRYGLYQFNNKSGDFKKVFPRNEIAGEKGNNNIRCLAADSKGNVWFGCGEGGLFCWGKGRDRPERINYNPGKSPELNTVSAIFLRSDGKIWIFGNMTFCIYDPFSRSARQFIISHRQRTLYEAPEEPRLINDVYEFKDGSVWFLNRGAGLLCRFEPWSEKLSLYRTPHFIVFKCLYDNNGSFWFGCVRNNIWRLTTVDFPYSVIAADNSAEVLNGARQKIITDNRGIIWLMLYRGMYRMNLPQKHSALKINKFRFHSGDSISRCIFQDKNGILWFGGRLGQVTRYDQATGIYSVYYIESKVKSGWDDIIRICEDSAGNIWAVSYRGGLYRYDNTKVKFEIVLDYNVLPEYNAIAGVADHLIDINGYHWLVTATGVYRLEITGMKIYNYSSVAVINGLLSGSYSRIRQDRNGNIWLLNGLKGIYRYERTSDSFSEFLKASELTSKEYYDIVFDSRNRLWLAHTNGITIFNNVTGESRTIKTPMLQFDVQGYAIDTSGIMYLNDNNLYYFENDVPSNKEAPPVFITRILVNGKEFGAIYRDAPDVRVIKNIKLRHDQSDLKLEFAALNWLDPAKNSYRYIMKGVDRDTVFAGTSNVTEYKKLNPGHYTFWVAGSNNDGIWNSDGVALDIRITPPWYRSALAFIAYGMGLIFLIFAYIRIRIKKLKEEKKYLQEQIELHTRELEIKNKQLEDTDRLKTRFFTDISHEIRTPLSLILGPLDSISAENQFDERTESLLEMMKRNGQRLMQLVTQMLDISRLDAGKMKIRLSESNLTLFLKIILYDFVSMAESRKIKYLVDISESQVITLFDRDKTEKIITNLLSNAFKYTKQGGTVSCRTEIREKINNGTAFELVISVADTGQGISSENIERIFERFFRVGEENETTAEGTGIGLSLTRELVELLHGTLEVDSRPGEGSLFRVTIPLGKGHLAEHEYTVIESSEHDATLKEAEKWKESEKIYIHNNGHQKPRILVIEDNEDLRRFICENLSTAYEMTDAGNGETGLNLGLTMLPDLVITDIMLPDLDGISICRQIRQDFHTSHIPVIILTARATGEDKLEGLRTGADDYIIKPFSMDELKARISNLLEQREKLKAKFRNYTVHYNTEGEPESVDELFIKRVVTVINENIKDFNFDVSALQSKLGMSRMHLFRKMKALTGLPPVIFMRNYRLTRAAELLRIKSGNITEVSYSVGMSNPAYFAKCFREYFGVTPRDYASSEPEPARE